jgi:hypothetical protein
MIILLTLPLVYKPCDNTPGMQEMGFKPFLRYWRPLGSKRTNPYCLIADQIMIVSNSNTLEPKGFDVIPNVFHKEFAV